MVFLRFSYGFPKVFVRFQTQENRKKTKRKPKENRRKPKKTKRKPKENQKKPTSERRQMALSRGGAEGRTAGPLGFGPHLRPLCGPPLQQQHDFWSSPVSVGSLGTPWSFVIILRATPSAPPWASPRYTARSLHLQNGQ